MAGFRGLTFAVGVAALAASAVAHAQTTATFEKARATYERGDFDAASAAFASLAKQGDPRAQYYLGLSYAKGEGMPLNDFDAVRWYKRAADQGHSAAQLMLGLAYSQGRGIAVDYVEAYTWLSIAAAAGEKDANAARLRIRRQLAANQLADAKARASAWKPDVPERASPPSSGSSGRAGQSGEIESTGSAFLVTSTGLLVTNAHVVEGCTGLTVRGGTALSVVSIDSSSDLALLKLVGASDRAALKLRQGRGVRLADNLIVAGYPLTGLLSSGLNVTTGAVSALAGPNDDRRLFQMTAPVQPGNSGGPVLDSSGNVVGVVVSKLDAVAVASINGDIPQNVNFAISLGTLQAFLDANAVDYGTRASTASKSNADVAEIARAATVQIECRS